MKNCPICHKDFQGRKTSQVYCSNQCSVVVRRKTVVSNCLNCKRDFNTVLSRVNDGKGKFCSKKCYLKYRNDKKISRTTECLVCGKSFIPPTTSNMGKFCSAACSHIGTSYIFQNRWSRKYKKCTQCGKSDGAYGSKGLCRKCRQKEDYRSGKQDNGRQRSRLKEFNLPTEEYRRILKEQNGVCAVCGKSELENKKELAIDHNHENGLVRGLLCLSCNLAAGLLRDNPVIIASLLSYIFITSNGKKFIDAPKYKHLTLAS